MELVYICKHCHTTSRIPITDLAQSSSIVCPKCGKTSGNQAKTPSAAPRFSDKLNYEQEQAATYDGTAGSIQVLAGAGTGKTRTMVARALFLLREKKVPPERIVMVTFTRRAAREMEDRIAQEIPDVKNKLFIGTIHKFCLCILHRFRAFFPYKEIDILDPEDQLVLLRKLRSFLHDKQGRSLANSSGVLPSERSLTSILSYCHNCKMELKDYLVKQQMFSAETFELLTQLFQNYQKYKDEHNLLDFDDILSVVATGLATNPELKRQVQNHYDHMLIDEMQDVSPVQWSIFQAIYPPIHLFCVGDDAQSIYSFRGADFNSVHHFCERLPNAITLKLTENYRSNQEILDVANEVLEDSDLQYDKRLVAHKGSASRKPKFYSFSSDEEEAAWIVRSLVEHLRNGVPYKEILVLLRFSAVARFLEINLRRLGIPYRLIGGPSFLQAAHVKDLISFLEALNNYQKELAWIRVLVMQRGIGAVGAEKIYASMYKNTIRQVEANHVMASILRNKAPEMASFIDHFVPSGDTPAMLQQIYDFYDTSHLPEEHYENWETRRKDLDVIMKIAEQHRSLLDFLESFKLDPDQEARENRKETEAITLITVHSAKGTEADVVYIPHMEHGVFPSYRSTSDDEIEEERRVLYVAITRARKELIFTQSRSNFKSSSGESEFLTTPVKKTIDFHQNRSSSRYDYNDI
ncbi:MAG: ATP-dependent helicase [Victivallales bacterium]|nr:ATP-dependent helicase [Victivallales bacterium]